MFNTRSHFVDADWDIECILSDADMKLYKARRLAAEPRYIWSPALKRVFDICLVHTSPHVPGKIEYYATLDAMRQNKRTRTSPEMFLERWLAQAPDDIKVAWEVETLGKILPQVLFIENTDPAGWASVYENGPYSCMQSKPHLVMQYANKKNDLALAYCLDKEGNITNRSIVNKAKKFYVRIFGKNGNIFASALKRLGYLLDPDGALDGQIIDCYLDTCATCDEQVVVGPYLDADHRGIRVITLENGEHEAEINRGNNWFCSACNDEEQPICGSCDS